MQKRIFILILIFALGFSSCGVYNFSGGSVSPEVKSISIQNFVNESGQGPPNISQLFTEKLKSYYQSNTKLLLAPYGGDWQLEGRIIGFKSTGVAPRGNETSGSNRLTIDIKVVFTNTKDEKQNFDQVFSFFADFEQQKSLSEVESALTETILNQIVLDVFQKTTSNW